MKWEKVNDNRLFPRPALYGRDGEVRLRFNVLSPLRLTFLQEVVFGPLMVIWVYVAGAFLIDCGTAYLGWFSVFNDYLPFSRLSFALVMTGLLSVWLIERFYRFPICRQVFGRRIHILVTPDELACKTGFFFWQRFSRQQELAFVQVPFDAATTPAYKNARQFCLIVGGTCRIEIAEVYGTGILNRVVNNANMALMIGGELFDLDIDPLFAPEPLGATP